MPRVVMITSDSPHARNILAALEQRGIVLDAALYMSGDFRLPSRRGLGIVGRILRWPKWTVAATRRKVKFRRERHSAYAVRAHRVLLTGFMNSRKLVADLRRVAPDWIIVGCGDILGPEVIATARAGVLNAHPALLPWIRGNGVTGASLEQGIALGATLHFIDRGIDTGPIVERRLLRVGEEERDYAQLVVRTLYLAAELMGDAVAAIVQRGEVPAGVSQGVRYRIYRWPDADGFAQRKTLAAAGKAHELYERWLPLCTDRGRGVLPSGELSPPVTE